MEFKISGRAVAFVLLLATALAQTATDPVNGTAPALPSCREEFRGQDPLHTMCKEDNENVVEIGISDKDKEFIIQYHNNVRRQVEPPATDLTDLTWDDKLAEVAQKLAQQCTAWHDKNHMIPGYGKSSSIGQNIAAGQPHWEKAMYAWFREDKLYKYGEDPKVYIGKGGWKKIGHYTVMVNNRIHRVGCGYAFCKDVRYGRFYICNYAGNQLSARYPYTNGTRCSACPDSCVDGLCACGGKYCMNKGRLDINTCTCTCQRNYHEEDCSQLTCPENDRGACGTRWPETYCKKYSNVPFDCPHMCGSCPLPTDAPVPEALE